MTRVVVTGVGIVSPLGIGVDDHWDRLIKGHSGEDWISTFDATDFPVRIAAEVPHFDLLQRATRFADVPKELLAERRTRFALMAAAMALEDRRVQFDASDAFLFGAGLGIVRLEDIANFQTADKTFDTTAFARNLNDIHPESLIRNSADLVNGLVRNALGLRGPSVTITSACTAGTQAIGQGFQLIREGRVEVALCGAADSMINPVGLAGFVILGAASTKNRPGQTSRPFDRGRTGVVMGEGAGMVTLESAERAQRRGARIYAEVTGYGTSLDAYRLTDPQPQGRGAVRAMRGALADAGLEPSALDMINAHGTSTPLNDRRETLAIKKVLGEAVHRVAITASKSMTGHLMAACGATEFIDTVLAVAHQHIPPTINQRQRDPDCDLDYVPNVSRLTRVRHALTNSFGLGGQNASLVVSSWNPDIQAAEVS
jgi:3-oxoacyl-[acyl-carrier-protein] synthase II